MSFLFLGYIPEGSTGITPRDENELFRLNTLSAPGLNYAMADQAGGIAPWSVTNTFSFTHQVSPTRFIKYMGYNNSAKIVHFDMVGTAVKR